MNHAINSEQELLLGQIFVDVNVKSWLHLLHVKSQEKSLLLQISFKLKISNVRILHFRFILNWVAHLKLV